MKKVLKILTKIRRVKQYQLAIDFLSDKEIEQTFALSLAGTLTTLLQDKKVSRITPSHKTYFVGEEQLDCIVFSFSTRSNIREKTINIRYFFDLCKRVGAISVTLYQVSRKR